MIVSLSDSIWMAATTGRKLNRQPAAPGKKKKIPTDNNLQLCDKTEGTVQSEVWPYNIYRAFLTEHRIHGIQ